MTDREEAERIVTSPHTPDNTLIDAVAIALSAARAEQREADALIAESLYADEAWNPHYRNASIVFAAAIRAGAPTPNQKGGDATNEGPFPTPTPADVAQPRSAELSGEAPVNRIVCWDEPLCLKPHFVAGYVARAPETEIITAQKGNFPERNCTDQEALDEFMVVHWAWFESTPETPAERQAKIVRWLRSRKRHLGGQQVHDEHSLLIADAIERNEYEGAEK